MIGGRFMEVIALYNRWIPGLYRYNSILLFLFGDPVGIIIYSNGMPLMPSKNGLGYLDTESQLEVDPKLIY